MHTYFVAKGDRPAFPDKEDLPRNDSASFDNFYIPIRGREGVKVHRITLVRYGLAVPFLSLPSSPSYPFSLSSTHSHFLFFRANVYFASEERSCYVDGNLVFCSKGVGKKQSVRVFLYLAG